MLGGDQRARTFVVEALPHGYEVVEVEGNVRAEGASEDQLDAAVATAVAARTTRQAQAVVERLRAAREPMEDGTETGTAAVDLERTVAAFQQGQVSVLLLEPDRLRARRLVVGPGPHDLALPGAPRTWQGDGVEVPADLALVRAAVLTDADVQVLPDGDPTCPTGPPRCCAGATAAPRRRRCGTASPCRSP